MRHADVIKHVKRSHPRHEMKNWRSISKQKVKETEKGEAKKNGANNAHLFQTSDPAPDEICDLPIVCRCV